jgi:hypothetical protein
LVVLPASNAFEYADYFELFSVQRKGLPDAYFAVELPVGGVTADYGGVLVACFKVAA